MGKGSYLGGSTIIRAWGAGEGVPARGRRPKMKPTTAKPWRGKKAKKRKRYAAALEAANEAPKRRMEKLLAAMKAGELKTPTPKPRPERDRMAGVVVVRKRKARPRPTGPSVGG